MCLFFFFFLLFCTSVLSGVSQHWLRGSLKAFTLCSTILLEKLTGLHLVKNFSAFYVTVRFITALTSARQLSLYWTSSIHFIPPHPTSWRSILILSSHLRLGFPCGLFPSGFPTKPCINLSSPPYALTVPPKSFLPILLLDQYLVRSTDH